MSGNKKKHKILFLDAYDSFSNNITSLLTTLLHNVDVYVLSIDSPLLDPTSPDFHNRFRRELAQYTAVVCGPGPGSPDNEADVGLMNYVWQLTAGSGLLPVLGICLGFQSLVKYGGGEVKRLKRGLHGMVREVLHCSDSDCGYGNGDGNIFHDVKPFKATLYHSLCGDIGQHEVSEADWKEDRGGAKWKAIQGKCPELLPLAWVEEERENGEVERILMGVLHLRKPFWGLQYHPESVCTEQEGNKVIENWFKEALRWNEEQGRMVVEVAEGERLAHQATKPSLLSRLQVPVGDDEQTTSSTATTGETNKIWWERIGRRPEYRSVAVRLPHGVQVSDVVEELGLDGSDKVVVLESANAAATASARADVRGRYSIIAAELDEALRLEYHTGNEYATLKLQSVNGLQVDLSERVFLASYGGIWGLVASFQETRSLGSGVELPDLPFLGGFVGFITYEQGLSDIDIHLENRQHHRPDVCLVWVTKSVIIDHTLGLVHIQELYSSDTDVDDDAWMRSIADRLVSTSPHHQHQLFNDLPSPAKRAKTRRPSTSTSIQTPLTKEYEAKVKACQEFIAAGDSYELCLTDQTKITRPLSDAIPSTTSQEHKASQQRPTSPTFNRKQQQRRRSSSSLVPTTTSTPVPSSWHLYKTLRSRQPAPFASYLRLGGVTLVSASPERFLTYDRRGRCSMRPMKGTVRKSESVSTLEQAEKILHVPKEEAENLMIVDLVRHDLHSICGAGNVEVSDLLKVEEYQSVFQMITVVEGQLPSPSSSHQDGNNRKKYTGLDVLAASLPPGSMTGAPKKRSCELLQQIEQHRERSLYSGVVGYMCVTGRGDWSVTIRSLFRWDDERVTVQGQGEQDGQQSEEEHEVWHIGAGGAVTILSTPEGEREEMFTKLAGPLRVFADLG
ncbi:ADC synthase [Pseudoneurospora amorphoporcata]|uniref:aminodeoxychorismate synthase n=1 Tax=Pseudoneurospora amorphoporcata TaxID=241081 RepID=A0AAN6NSZ2_9PEZI|nr:ADC synthase [Pseudoneurospora amorphoporcata]